MENQIYDTISPMIQETARSAIVASFCGAAAIASLKDPEHRRLAKAAQIANTVLNIEQRWPEQIPPADIAPFGNAVMREAQKMGKESPKDAAFMASRIVSSVESQNLAGEVLEAIHYQNHHGRPASNAHPEITDIAQKLAGNPDSVDEITIRASGRFEKLSPEAAMAFKKEVHLGETLSPTQTQSLQRIGKMSGEEIDLVQRLGQMDLTPLHHTATVVTRTVFDPKLHEEPCNDARLKVTEHLDTYAAKPNGLTAFDLWNSSKELIEKMDEAKIDVRVRQSFEITARDLAGRLELKEQEAEASLQANIARIRRHHVANHQSQSMGG